MKRGSSAAWRREAIRRMEQSRRATLSFLSGLPEREILRPRTQGQWSIKDVLAHIVAWEEEGVGRLALVRRGHGHRVRFYDDMREVNRWNARAVSRARSLSFSSLLRRAARVRRRLIEALRRLPPGTLRDPSHEVPVVGWLPQFAWRHEKRHLREIRVWWRRRRFRLAGP
jgi:uncharacterized damage-inducible protein DinB